MKTLIFLLLFALELIAQKPTSFYFAESQPNQLPNILKFDNTICGEYYLKGDSLTRLVITPDSIFSRQNVFFMFTKDDIAKSKGKYYIEGEKMYGIVDGKGLFFATNNDTTFAVYNQEEIYFKSTTDSPLRKQGNSYFLNEKQEDNYYSSLLVFPTKKGILIYSIDHEEVMYELRKFNQLDSLQLNGFKTYIANPTLEEMNLFIQNKGFKDVTVYYKPKYFPKK